MFARYPIYELIIHPRTRVEFYKGIPHREAFAKAHAALDRPLCYNGDLFCEEDCRELMRQFPNTHALMLGRGLIANPALAQSLGGGEALCKASLRAFHDRLLAAYQTKYPAHVTLGRMREIAKHFVCCFDAPEKPRKAIRKATRIEAYLDAIDRLFAEHELNETRGLSPNNIPLSCTAVSALSSNERLFYKNRPPSLRRLDLEGKRRKESQ